MCQNNKIAVIGAGIIGLSIAKSLTDQGFHVSLFDNHGVAQKCSKGNAGHFATEQIFPLAQPSLLYKLPSMLLNPYGGLRIDWRYIFKAAPWFIKFIINMRSDKRKAHTEALKSLNMHAMEAYKHLLGPVKFQQLIESNGSLLTFENTSESCINKLYQQLIHHNIPVQWLTGEQIFSLEPHLSKRIRHALLFTEVGHSADPYKLCLHLFSSFKKAGGKYFRLNIENIQHNDGYIELKSSDKTQYRFDKVIICTGAWSSKLTKQLGFKVPLDTERGYHAMINSNCALSRPVASAERQFIMTPMTHGLRLAGTVEFAGLDAPENHHRATMLIKHANEILNEHHHKDINQTWMGCRPSLPDSLPVIGESPKQKNVYFAFGHQHLGLTQGAITAKLITQLCLGQTPCLDLRPYRINRF